VRNYLREIASDAFLAKYGSGPVRIFISCNHHVSGAARALIASLQQTAEAQGVDLQLVRQMGQ
jgi:hypothetical protein